MAPRELIVTRKTLNDMSKESLRIVQQMNEWIGAMENMDEQRAAVEAAADALAEAMIAIERFAQAAAI